MIITEAIRGNNLKSVHKTILSVFLGEIFYFKPSPPREKLTMRPNGIANENADNYNTSVGHGTPMRAFITPIIISPFYVFEINYLWSLKYDRVQTIRQVY